MKLAAWLETLTPDASHWGLVDKHRAQYLVFTALLLVVFSAGSLLLWLIQDSLSALIIPAWVLLLAVSCTSLLLLYRLQSIQLATQTLLVGHFIIYNGLMLLTGYHQSPMVLNLFYIPLIALLPGESRIAVIWSLVTLAAVALQYVLSFFPDMLQAAAVPKAQLSHWFHWNLMGCVLLSGVLALAYDKTVRDMTAILAHEKKQFEKDSLTDNLTGVANQTHLHQYLEATIYHSKKLNQMIGVVAVNIEAFGSVNERYGSHTGDQVLQLLAARIQNVVRGSDLVARFEGDSFVIVLPNIKQANNLNLVIEKLQRQLEQPLITRKHELSLDYDIRGALYPVDGESAEALLDKLVSATSVEALVEELDYA